MTRFHSTSLYQRGWQDSTLAAVEIEPVPNVPMLCPAGYAAPWAETLTSAGKNSYTSVACGDLSKYKGIIVFKVSQLDQIEDLVKSLAHL